MFNLTGAWYLHLYNLCYCVFMGRKKFEITRSDMAQVEKLAGYGLTIEMIVNVLGVSKRTFERRCKESKPLFDALLKGRSIAAMNVAKTAYELAVSGKCPTMTIFYLKSRLGWQSNPLPSEIATTYVD